LSNSIESLLSNDELRKIGERASANYRGQLSKDEIRTCIDKAIWSASHSFDEKKGVKFTSFLYHVVVNECNNTVRFNSSNFYSIERGVDGYSISGKFDGFEKVDIMDEIANCGDPQLVYDRFYLNKSYRELASDRNVSGELIRIRLEKCLKKIKNSFA